MKKTLILFAAVAMLASCKKNDETTDFTPTDVTGTMVLKGNVNKNVITPNGSGGWTNSARIPAAGVSVSVKVNKNSLYPNSTAQGADIYTATTDANGNYSVTVKANATGVQALIAFDGFTGTQDTIINGTVKAGLYSSYQSASVSRVLYMGQNAQQDYQFSANVVSTNPNNNLKIGSATITGSVGLNYLKQITTGTVVSITTTLYPASNHVVYLNFYNDPSTQAMKQYTTTTDANGYYSFNVSTVESNAPGFSQQATVFVNDFAATRDTIMSNNTIKTGKAGVYQSQTINQFNVYNNNIRNAVHFNMNSFTQN